MWDSCVTRSSVPVHQRLRNSCEHGITTVALTPGLYESIGYAQGVCCNCEYAEYIESHSSGKTGHDSSGSTTSECLPRSTLPLSLIIHPNSSTPLAGAIGHRLHSFPLSGFVVLTGYFCAYFTHLDHVSLSSPNTTSMATSVWLCLSFCTSTRYPKHTGL